MRAPQDSAGRPIGVGDRVNWRGKIYTIKSFGDPVGVHGTRVIVFNEELLHITGEVPDEFGVDLVEAAPRTRCPWCGDNCPRFGNDVCPMRPQQLPRTEEPVKADCTDHTPSWFVGHWRDWHRGHGCNKDDGKPRTDAGFTEVTQHAANEATGFLTDAELRFLRASTTSGNTMLVRALDELAARRVAERWNAPLRPGLAHCMTGAPGYSCSCGTIFEDYYALAEHVRQTIDCPSCGGAPADLGDGDLYRWKCGHWIARGDLSAKISGGDSNNEGAPAC